MNSEFIVDVLRKNHPEQAGWIFLTEVPTRIGYWAREGPDLDSRRSIDAFAIQTWRNKNFCRVAYEIKVNRADWLLEIRDCRKRTHAYFLSNRFYFAVAPGVINLQKDEISCLDGCGILEIQTDASLILLQAARNREAWPMPDHFVASLLRRAMRGAKSTQGPLQLVLPHIA